MGFHHLKNYPLVPIKFYGWGQNSSFLKDGIRFWGRFERTSMPFGSRLVSGFIAAMKSYVSRLSDAPIRIARRVDE